MVISPIMSLFLSLLIYLDIFHAESTPLQIVEGGTGKLIPTFTVLYLSITFIQQLAFFYPSPNFGEGHGGLAPIRFWRHSVISVRVLSVALTVFAVFIQQMITLWSTAFRSPVNIRSTVFQHLVNVWSTFSQQLVKIWSTFFQQLVNIFSASFQHPFSILIGFF